MKRIILILLAAAVFGSCSTRKMGFVSKEELPCERVFFSTEVVDNKIYVIGGGFYQDSYKGNSIVEVYNPANINTWARKTDMPTARWLPASSVVDKKIYVIGGEPEYGGPSLSTVEMYDPASDNWVKKTDMPTARHGHAAAAIDGVIYVFGGLSFTKKVEAYNTNTDTWVTKSDMPTPRFLHEAIAVNGMIYIIGGDDWSSSKDWVEVYNPKTDVWTKKSKALTNRSGFAVGEVDGNIYLFGGSSVVYPYDKLVSTVEKYDPEKDQWEIISNLPEPRMGCSAGTIGNQIYIIGGSTTGFSFNPVGTTDLFTVKS